MTTTAPYVVQADLRAKLLKDPPATVQEGLDWWNAYAEVAPRHTIDQKCGFYGLATWFFQKLWDGCEHGPLRDAILKQQLAYEELKFGAEQIRDLDRAIAAAD